MNRKVRKAIRKRGASSAAHVWYASAHWGRFGLMMILMGVPLDRIYAPSSPKGAQS